MLEQYWIHIDKAVNKTFVPYLSFSLLFLWPFSRPRFHIYKHAHMFAHTNKPRVT